jgi:hypothetical protein
MKTPEELAKDLFGKFGDTTIQADTVVVNAKNILDGGPKGTLKNPYSGGRSQDAGLQLSGMGGWSSTVGMNSGRQKVKQFAEKQGYKPGDFFTLTEGNKADNTLKTWTFKVEKDGNITNVSKKATGGLLKGPGTGTSDSILAQYAEGGMVRVSNGEYIINAETVKNLGVPFFDRLNGMKTGGLMVNYDMPRYALGGRLAYNEGGQISSPSSNNALYNINVNLNGSNLSPDDVARAISREMQIREAMNGRVRSIRG